MITTVEEFNNKYKAFIEPGFEDQGLEIEDDVVVAYLDKVFEDLTRIPGFNYAQIKVKFGGVRFYAHSITGVMQSMIEDYIKDILNEKTR